MKNLFVSLSSVALAACAFGASSLACGLVESVSGNALVSYGFPAQVKVGAAELAYDLVDLEDAPLSSISKISTRLWMPSMNHGSRPVKTLEKGAKAHFETQGAYFMMAGIWEVIIDIELADGSKDTFRVPVRVSR